MIRSIVFLPWGFNIGCLYSLFFRLRKSHDSCGHDRVYADVPGWKSHVFCLLLGGRTLKYNSCHLLYIYFYFFAGYLSAWTEGLINSLNWLLDREVYITSKLRDSAVVTAQVCIRQNSKFFYSRIQCSSWISQSNLRLNRIVEKFQQSVSYQLYLPLHVWLPLFTNSTSRQPTWESTAVESPVLK